MHSDSQLRQPMNGHGGSREGAGRFKDGERPPEVTAFNQSKARNESAKAQLNELKLLVETGRYVSRDAVRQASAATMAALAQSLRSIPDNLERLGLGPEWCMKVQAVLDAAMADAAAGMEMMAGAAPPAMLVLDDDTDD